MSSIVAGRVSPTMAKRSAETVPPVDPTVPELPELLVDELVLLLVLDDVVLLDDELDDVPPPQLDGAGGAWHLQVSTLHHQPP